MPGRGDEISTAPNSPPGIRSWRIGVAYVLALILFGAASHACVLPDQPRGPQGVHDSLLPPLEGFYNDPNSTAGSPTGGLEPPYIDDQSEQRETTTSAAGDSVPGPILTPLTPDLSERRPIPVAATASERRVQIERRTIPLDDGAWTLGAATPVVIYRSPVVALAAPESAGRKVESAVVRRVAANTDAGARTCPVRGGVAVLWFLEDGAYDVWYEAAGERSLPKDRRPDRRFLVETADPNLANCIAPAVHEEPASIAWAPSFERGTPCRLDSAACEATRRGWDLLERRAWYSAHREFSAALTAAACGSDAPSTAAEPDRWNQLLGRAAEVDLSSPGGRRLAESVGAELAHLFAQRPEASRAFHGLARAYCEFARDERPLVASPSERAAACWRAASILDPACADPLNELGMFYFARGWVEDAADCFREAARVGTDPASLYNLGRCLESQGRRFDAMLAYERALAVDDQLHAATASLCRLQLLAGAPAIYEEQLPLLLHRLADVARYYESNERVAVWAAEASRRLADLAAESRWNRPGMAVRRLLPRETGAGTPERLAVKRRSPTTTELLAAAAGGLRTGEEERPTSISPVVDSAAGGCTTTHVAGEMGPHRVRNAHLRITGVDGAPRRNP